MLKKEELEALLSYFPTIELPVILSENTIIDFSKENQPLPNAVVGEVLSKFEEINNEYVEIVPCFSIRDREHFDAIVYWKGELMKYEYILATFEKNGNLISKKSVSSVLSDGSTVKKSIAQIDEDLIIHIMAGESLTEKDYDPENSQAFNMEIMPTGEIEFSLGD